MTEARDRTDRIGLKSSLGAMARKRSLIMKNFLLIFNACLYNLFYYYFSWLNFDGPRQHLRPLKLPCMYRCKDLDCQFFNIHLESKFPLIFYSRSTFRHVSFYHIYIYMCPSCIRFRFDAMRLT